MKPRSHSVIRKKQKESKQLTESVHQKLLRLRVLKTRMKWNDIIEACFAMSGLGFAVMEADDFFSHAGGKERYVQSDYGMTLRYGVSVTTFFVLILCVRHSYLNFIQ